MNKEDLLDYINLLTPVLEEYAKEKNTTIEDLLLTNISIKDTNLFHTKTKIYSIFKKNKITTLQELFTLYDNNQLVYIPNNYIQYEIDSIIELLKLKYLSIPPVKLPKLLNQIINSNNFSELSFLLRSCGFNEKGTNILVNIAYKNQYTNITLSEFLSKIIEQNPIENKEESKYITNIINLIQTFQKETSNKKRKQY